MERRKVFISVYIHIWVCLHIYMHVHRSQRSTFVSFHIYSQSFCDTWFLFGLVFNLCWVVWQHIWGPTCLLLCSAGIPSIHYQV